MVDCTVPRDDWITTLVDTVGWELGSVFVVLVSIVFAGDGVPCKAVWICNQHVDNGSDEHL